MPDLRNNKITIIIWLCFLTGTLDATAAILISHNISPNIVFRYIASGWFGQAAFSGGSGMVVMGLLFHYLIASFYSVVFFLSYPYFAKVFRNEYLIAVVFAVIIWVVMNFLVLPLTNVPKRPGHMSFYVVAEGLGALFLCLGVPISLMANRHYRRNFLKKTVDLL